MVGPDYNIIFFHKFRCLYSNFSSARNHPADNSDTVRKYDRTFGCRFPEFSGKHFVIQWEHKCQCNRICGMCMVNNTMLSISKFFLYFMIHQMCRKLACRSSSLNQSPTDTVIAASLIQFDNCKTYFRVNNDISEIFTASCHKKKFACQSRYFGSDRCPFSRCVQTRTDHFDFLCLQTIA